MAAQDDIIPPSLASPEEKKRRREFGEDEFDLEPKRSKYQEGHLGREKWDSRRERHSSAVEEKTEVYRIVSDGSKFEKFEVDAQEDLRHVLVTDERRMRESGWVEPEVVDALWAQKDRMDEMFDAGKGDIYYKTRDRQFPQDRKGSSNFSNRAGDKLWQVFTAIDDTLLDPLPPGSSFFDICGGPGAFSQLLLDKYSELRNGYGMTLRTPMTATNDYWYPQLEKHSRFNILWGADDQGDVYVPANLESAVEAVKMERISVVVSDGGFKIQKLDDKHMENLQELFSGRIVLAEFCLDFLIGAEKSHFVVKLFDSFSHLTVSLIYLATMVFEEVYVVKPIKSRIVNSERYLAAKRRKPESEITKFCTELIRSIHRSSYEFAQKNPDQLFSPNSAVPLALMASDPIFTECITAMNNELGRKQTAALKQIMDAAVDQFSHHKKLDQRKQRFSR
jgi:23S rRNA U2552 (ribose-2'-O)-methylase RlmE/FtsJ